MVLPLFSLRSLIETHLAKNARQVISLFLGTYLLGFICSPLYAADGAGLFEQKCSACHQVSDQTLVGPGLKDVTKRREKDWIKKFITNSQALVKAGDKQAVELFDKFKIVMPEHPLSDEELEALYAYLESNGTLQGAKKPKPEEATAEEIAKGRDLFSGKAHFEKKGVSCYSCHSAGDVHVQLGRLPGKDLTHSYYVRYPKELDEVLGDLGGHEPTKLYQGFSLSDEEMYLIKAFLYDADLKGPGARSMGPHFLLGGFVFLLIIFTWYFATKKLRGFGPLSSKEKTLIGLSLVGLLVLVGGYGVMITGRSANYNTGYAPEQPLAFSHKLHAGVNKIQCQYCHFASEQGRHAGIPPTELCLNCHTHVKKDSPLINQVKEAVESGKNIEWIKVNHFPDHAYFNHAQHVKVAGLKCQQCHGNVETMDVLKQVKPLNMGWCIQCHRSNGVAPPEDHKSAKGGDCARCHH